MLRQATIPKAEGLQSFALRVLGRGSRFAVLVFIASLRGSVVFRADLKCVETVVWRCGQSVKRAGMTEGLLRHRWRECGMRVFRARVPEAFGVRWIPIEGRPISSEMEAFPLSAELFASS